MAQRTKQLHNTLEAVYQDYQDTLLFHGWHHITFVARKSLEFADELDVDKELVAAAALVHDLNYIVDAKSLVDAGRDLRTKYLAGAGFASNEIEHIETIVHTASTEHRNATISDEAKALSDADALFKVLPVGPLILSSRFITETGTDIRKWADRIIREQQPLLDQGTFFYTDTAKQRYLEWAEVNLHLVRIIQNSFDDPDIQLFLADCKNLGFLS
jgi:uncharacterized protein